MIVTYLILAAPIVAAALFWGSWAWVAIAAVVALVEFLALQRSQQFSARFWRTIGAGRRSRRERGTERVYVASALAGGALLVAALVSFVG
jgi:hypothetical protein